MDLSVVIPCLNEVETISKCIKKAKKEIEKLDIDAEIIVSDNGSNDGSIELSKSLGAKVIHVMEKGYGVAVYNGIKSSQGKYIIIADADDSYNFEDLTIFYKKILEGYDIVQGCRMPSGGGKIEKNAMPKSHQYIGNPFFSFICKIFFSLPFNDVYCGMKILRKDFYKNIDFFSNGMVFCIEILIKSIVSNAKVSEIPIKLYKDGRKLSKSHLRTLHDGLATLKFILICCPKWIYFVPAFLFFFFSFIIFFSLNIYPDLKFYNIVLSSLIMIYLSFQLFILGLFTSVRSKNLGLYKGDWLNSFFKIFSLKLSIFISIILVAVSFLITLHNFVFFSKDIEFLLAIFLIFFSISITANSLFVSLLSLNK